MTVVYNELGEDIKKVAKAAFVFETIGRIPPGKQPIRFEWSSKKQNIPERPWSFGTEVLRKRTDYPGSVHSPSEQVLSVMFSDFTINGTFKDKWNYPGYAIDEMRKLELLSTYGTMVRMKYGSIYVDGIVASVNFDYMTDDEIGYSITLSPHNREPGKKLRSSPRTVLTSRQLLGELVSVRDLLADIHSNSPRFFLVNNLWSDATEIIEEQNTLIQQLENIIKQRIILPQVEPGVALGRIASVFRLVKASGERLVDLLDELHSTTSLTYLAGVEVLRFDAWAKGLLSGTRMLMLVAENASRELESRILPNMIAVYRPRAGEHLMGISQQFYDTPSNWRRIATRNHLGSALTLTGKEILLIPEAVSRK